MQAVLLCGGAFRSHADTAETVCKVGFRAAFIRGGPTCQDLDGCVVYILALAEGHVCFQRVESQFKTH